MHYAPFYLMGRQLFLHHYLPAHLSSCLVTGALLEFILNTEPSSEDEVAFPTRKTPGVAQRRAPIRQKPQNQSMLISWAVVGVIMTFVVAGWYFFLPLTYGYPGLTVPEVQARKWLGYDLHFAK